jgi:hypothetical protein
MEPGTLRSDGTFSARPGRQAPLAKGQLATEKKQMSLGKIAVAAATFASVTLLSFGTFGPNGVSLSVASAQAQEQEQVQNKALQPKAQIKAREGRAMRSREMTSEERTSRRAARMSPRDERRASRRVEREGRVAGRYDREGRVAQRYYGERRYYGANPVEVGADVAAGAAYTAGAVAAGALNTAGAIVGAATSPYDAYASGPYSGWDNGYYASSAWGDYECRPGWSGCQPYSAKGWK